MTIKNQTAVTLTIMGTVLNPSKHIPAMTKVVLEPSQFSEFPKSGFSTFEVQSEIGDCLIVTAYYRRSFKNSEKLKAEDGPAVDEHGMREIIISSAN